MARYFSEQTLLDMRDKDMNYVYDLTDLEQYLAGLPTAGVVPKSEVAREIFDETEKRLDEEISRICQIREERRIKLLSDAQLLCEDRKMNELDGMLQSLCFAKSVIEGLKKKYTGGKYENDL